jgi:PA14 domain-containing protein/flagellar hook capping protein FlgD
METTAMSSSRRGRGSRWRVSLLLAVLLGTPSAAEAATSFTFTLAQGSKTSAGVFSVGGSSDGTLIKTLWSGVFYAAGTYTKEWDGTDDAGHLAPDGNYQVRVLRSHATYQWEGVVGNTSAEKTGDTVFHFASTISGMAIVGSMAYFGAGYNEGGTSQARFVIPTGTENPTGKENILQRGAEFYKVASDGTNVYWAGGDFTSRGFVIATPVGSTTTQTQFQAGQPVDTTPQNGIIYTHAIDIMTADPTLPYPTGLAVQPGTNGYLFVSWGGQDSLHVLNKTTGVLVSAPNAYYFIAPGDLAIGPVDPGGNGSLWMIHGPAYSRVVQRFTVRKEDGVLLPAAVTISGLDDPLALAYQDGTLLVADGGQSQQVKAFNEIGAPLWELPEVDPAHPETLGGYQFNPVVTNDRFDFEPRLEYTNTNLTPATNPGARAGILARGTFLAFQPDDGSFWVGDTGCYRVQHFSAGRVFKNQIAYIPSFYSAAADPNNPRRVFANWLEFDVNYDLPLGPANGSWSLVQNWRYGLQQPVDYPFWRTPDVTTLSNGRTYVNKGYAFELPGAGGGQATNTLSEIPGRLFADGSARTAHMDFSTSVETWKSYPVHFEDDRPVWASTPTPLANVTLGLNDPRDYAQSDVRMTSPGNVIVTFDVHSLVTDPGSPYHQGWHLAGIRKDTNQWLWKASNSTPLNYIGTWPTDGTFPITHVGNAGGSVMTVDRHIFYGYRGEGWRPGIDTTAHCIQTNKFRHYHEDGLFVDEFGPTWMDVGCVEAPEGMAGNAFSEWMVKLADGRVYMYHNDESWHGGLHRWRIDNLSSVAEDPIAVELHKDTDRGLNAEYFDTPDWNNLNVKTARLDPQVWFNDWNAGSPSGTGLTADQSFSVRWSGYVTPQVSGNHKFRVETQAPASAQVRVDGRKLAPTDDIDLSIGVYYPIAIEYRHVPGSPAPTGPKLKWSPPAQGEQDVLSAQLSAVPPGKDLLDGLPSSGMLANGTAGWARTPAADANTGYWHRWNVDIEQNSGNPYLHIHRMENTAGATAAVTRDLGAPSDSTGSWDVSMMVSYAGSLMNDQMVCGQSLDLLDDAGKVIATIYPNMYDYPNDGRMVANGEAIVQTDVSTLINEVIPPWRPLRISAADGQITFKYGDYPAKTTAVYDPTAKWRRVKTLRAYYWTGQTYCARETGIDIDRLRLTTTDANPAIDLLAGLPSDSDLNSWGVNGDYGWKLTPTYVAPPNWQELPSKLPNGQPNPDHPYWTSWWVSTNQKTWQRSPPVDIGIVYTKTYNAGGQDNPDVVFARDLGTPSDVTKKWEITGRINNDESAGNPYTRQNLEVWDDANRLIARYEAPSFLPSWEWKPLGIVGENAKIQFFYGSHASAPMDPLGNSNWRRAKTVRIVFWKEGNQGQRSTGTAFLDDLEYRVTRAQIPPDPVLWLRADQIAGQNGDPVSLWADASGGGHNASQPSGTFQPVLRTGAQGLNGKNVVSFDGVDDYLRTSFGSSAAGMTVFYIVRTGSTVPLYGTVFGSGGAIYQPTAGIRWRFGLGPSDWGAGWAGPDAWVNFGTVPGIGPNATVFARYRKDGTGWSIDGVNNVTVSDTSMPSGTFNGIVGAESTRESEWAYFFKGDIAEILVYGRPLGDAECADVKLLLKAKWGLP